MLDFTDAERSIKEVQVLAERIETLRQVKHYDAQLGTAGALQWSQEEYERLVVEFAEEVEGLIEKFNDAMTVANELYVECEVLKGQKTDLQDIADRFALFKQQIKELCA